jgi:serine/threonine-protein kinase
MSLERGARLGPYEIGSLLGVGGMGEVYRATDSNLKRAVAVKVLPASVAGDADRLARFQREAEVLGALNHPSIAAIYGLERSGDMIALVMELVEGDDLSQRIARGAMPIDEVLPIAKQIADALEAAHEQGIIHRDLKPANIKVRADGMVKVLDFGLAKAMEPATSPSSNISMSPTIMTPAMTQVGIILGTAAYMAPEQARGLRIDKRADLWAFGCVVYEMLTGRRAFEGDDVTVTLANIVRGEPAWDALPVETPPSVRRLLRRCLLKDLKQRLGEASGAILDINDAQTELKNERITAAPPRAARRRRLVVALASVAIGMTVAGGVGWELARRLSVAPPIVRFSVPLGAINLGTPTRRLIALSPDGSSLAYAASGRVYVRSMNDAIATAVHGTEGQGVGSRNPFFSPDGQWLGFWTSGTLRKVPTSGGAPVILGRIEQPWGASWELDGTILVGQGSAGILRVPANGGTPETLIRVKDGEQAEGPQRLPDPEWVLFTVRRASADWNQGEIVAQSVRTGERRVLVSGGHDGRYLPTGHIVYLLNTALYGVRFDPRATTVIGGPVSLVEGVAGSLTTGAAQFSVARTGALVYLDPTVNGAAGGIQTLVWVDRDGREEPLKFDSGAYVYPRLSPDGTRVAVAVPGSTASDIWVIDTRRGSRTRITFDGNNQYYPVWAADGGSVFVSDAAATKNRVRRAPASGTGAIETLLEGEERYPTSASHDGRLLLFYQVAPQTSRDLWVLPLDGPRKPVSFLATPYDDCAGLFSPDGHWLAFVSNKSGQSDVYVRPYPPAGTQEYTISAGGGTEPRWAPTGRELIYRHGSDVMSVAITVSAGSLIAAPPVRLFTGGFALDVSVTQTMANYDIAGDGRRLLMLKPAGGANQTTPPINVVLNWTEELKQRVPTK